MLEEALEASETRVDSIANLDMDSQPEVRERSGAATSTRDQEKQ